MNTSTITTPSSTLRIDPDGIVQAAIREQIELGRELGVQVAAYLDGELAVHSWDGVADPASGRPVDGDTLFNVYSVSKAVILTALHLQVDRGLLDYDAPVSRYWPEYGVNGKAGTTVRHVVTHRAGVPQMPEGVTPETICEWEWMTSRIAALTPIAEPGTKALYQSMTLGWLVGELVRRSDPQRRPIGQFVREELAVPLHIENLWIGLPDLAVSRLARHVDATPVVPPEFQPALAIAATPSAVTLSPSIYTENARVRKTGIPAVGGIFTAISGAKFFGMLAGGGTIGGTRLLSEQMVDSLHIMRDNPGEPDAVMYGIPIPLTIGGFWRGGDYPPVCSVKHDNAICHPGFGNSIAWADRDRKLAVAIFHNRMSQPNSLEEDSILPIANAVRRALNLD